MRGAGGTLRIDAAEPGPDRIVILAAHHGAEVLTALTDRLGAHR